jgi:hypothetical protein
MGSENVNTRRPGSTLILRGGRPSGFGRSDLPDSGAGGAGAMNEPSGAAPELAAVGGASVGGDDLSPHAAESAAATRPHPSKRVRPPIEPDLCRAFGVLASKKRRPVPRNRRGAKWFVLKMSSVKIA